MEGETENMEYLISYLHITQGKRYYFPLVKGCLPQKAPIVGNALSLPLTHTHTHIGT